MERIIEKDDIQQIMNEEAHGYFIKGLKIAIKQTGLKQKDFAEGVTSAVNLSNILRGETGTSDEMRAALAKKAGKDVLDIVLMGRHAANDGSRQADEGPGASMPGIPGIDAQHVNPMDVLSSVSTAAASLSVASTAVSTLVGQYQKLDSRMRFWRAIFDELPIPTLIVRDEIVVYQNVKSSAWGNITGEALCDSCACPEDCKVKKDCPIYQAMETRNPVSGYQHIGAGFYKVNITPMRLHDHEYFIIVATEADIPEGAERRSGADRRGETTE